jgi:hypothetical protein
MIDDDSFSAEQVAMANSALRAALGLLPEKFSSRQFVGMISEEIEGLRAAGRSDADISRILEEAAGIRLDPEAFASTEA